MGRPGQIRPSEELVEIINYVRARCLLDGRKPPSVTVITRAIAKNVKKERLWEDEFAR